VVAVDPVPLQPGAVVGEVVTGRTDEHRPQAQPAQAEAHVGGDTAPADLEVVDEEGDRELVQLLDHEGVLEPSPEGHQVVSGNGPGNEQGASSVGHEREA